MKSIKWVAGALALGLLASAGTIAVHAEAAKALTDAKGMTLYTFDKDAPGKSNCNGQCAVNWPPFMATGAPKSADWTAIKRDDGSMQWAYKGKPLYGWIKDTKPGDMTGDGVGGSWHTATP